MCGPPIRVAHHGTLLQGLDPGRYSFWVEYWNSQSTIMKSVGVIVDTIIIVHKVYNNVKHTLILLKIGAVLAGVVSEG